MIIEFSIPCLPCAKQSMRMRVVSKNGKTFAMSYPDGMVKQNAATLASLMAPYRPKVPMRGPVVLTLQVVYPWLKGHSMKKRLLFDFIPKATAPDADNLCKAVCDVLQREGFVVNDGQIYRIEVSKVHSHQLETRIKLVEI